VLWVASKFLFIYYYIVKSDFRMEWTLIKLFLFLCLFLSDLNVTVLLFVFCLSLISLDLYMYYKCYVLFIPHPLNPALYLNPYHSEKNETNLREKTRWCPDRNSRPNRAPKTYQWDVWDRLKYKTSKSRPF
jgi:hypothetical protein